MHGLFLSVIKVFKASYIRKKGGLVMARIKTIEVGSCVVEIYDDYITNESLEKIRRQLSEIISRELSKNPEFYDEIRKIE